MYIFIYLLFIVPRECKNLLFPSNFLLSPPFAWSYRETNKIILSPAKKQHFLVKKFISSLFKKTFWIVHFISNSFKSNNCSNLIIDRHIRREVRLKILQRKSFTFLCFVILGPFYHQTFDNWIRWCSFNTLRFVTFTYCRDTLPHSWRSRTICMKIYWITSKMFRIISGSSSVSAFFKK